MFIKIPLIFALFLGSSLLSADTDVSIDGLIHDQVISRVGQLFYEDLVNAWQPPVFDGSITVHERPDSYAGNVIWVEVNDVTIYEARIGFRPNGIEEKAQEARSLLMRYLLEHKQILQELEGIK